MVVTQTVRNDFLLGIVYKTKPAVIDDLTMLRGVGDVLAARLQELGVFTYKQIGLWTEEQAHEFSRRLGFNERAEREHWVQQATKMYEIKYGRRI